jgi:hypothetical protein
MFPAAKRVAAAVFAASLLIQPALAQEQEQEDSQAGTPEESQEAPMESAPVDFAKYMVHSATLAAVVTAISMVEPCSVPIQFEEIVVESYETLELIVTCNSGQFEDEGSVIVRFLMLEGGVLVPQSYELAG